jgi:hypothetical protein
MQPSVQGSRSTPVFIPFGVMESALSVAANWTPLTLALHLSRNDAFRLVRSVMMFARLACAVALASVWMSESVLQSPCFVRPYWTLDREPTLKGPYSTKQMSDVDDPASRQLRCRTARLLLQVLGASLRVCEPQQTALEVVATASPPAQLLPLLHSGRRVVGKRRSGCVVGFRWACPAQQGQHYALVGCLHHSSQPPHVSGYSTAKPCCSCHGAIS